MRHIPKRREVTEFLLQATMSLIEWFGLLTMTYELCGIVCGIVESPRKSDQTTLYERLRTERRLKVLCILADLFGLQGRRAGT